MLIVGRTGCGKTYFIKKLVVNNFFGDIVKAEWVSYIQVDKTREAGILSFFNCDTEFCYPRNKGQFDDLLEEFKVCSKNSSSYIVISSLNSSKCGENVKRERLIVMNNDVSGLVDTSHKSLQSFLTVDRKFKYNRVYMFHAIHLEKLIWKSILSQTNIFNISPASVPLLNVTKILQTNRIRKTLKYLPVISLWINKLFIKLTNESDNICLTIDCSGFNPNESGRFRTNAGNPVS